MKERILILAILILNSYLVNGQRIIIPTDSFTVSGKIMNPMTFTLSDLDTFPKTVIQNQIIYNQNGEIKDTLTGLKGIPLKTLLAPIVYNYGKPKILNEFYFVFIGSDNYKVVFSWNEIYNTEAGNNFFIVTELEKKKGTDSYQRILFISTADLKAGRRCIKGLEKIEVRQVE